MATTTNYGWTTPDDTALVKDGAAAIRTLGSSVDTTTKALNPSTTLGDIEYRSSTANTNTRLGIGSSGQVLTVAAGVPSWATPTAGMTNPMTTTGDTIYSSSGSTPARLGIGSTGQVLTVSGGIPSWATPAGGGGMTSIASGSLSGSSINITSISGSYKNLQLVIRNFRPSDDGAELYATINSGSSNYGRSASISELNVNATSNFWTQFSRRQDNGASTSLMQYDFPDYSNATTHKLVEAFAMTNDSVDTTQWNIQRSSFVVRQTAAITSIQFYPDTGTFTSGTYILYGVN